jgi:putative spermidine/putrescine transport system substrate-binding protein
MKRKVMFALVILCLAIGTTPLFARGSGEAPPEAKDVLSMSWDELVAAAKAEGQVVLYVWYKQDYFVDALAAFKQKYGIDAQVVVAGEEPANFNKAVAEKDMATGTMDAMIVGGKGIKPVMDLKLMLGPLKPRIPHADKFASAQWEKQEGVETMGYLVPFMRNQTGLLYDPEKVAKPPQTWGELTAFVDANPKRFGFNDPSKGGSGQSFVHTLLKWEAGGLDKYYGDTEVEQADVADWGQAWDWVNKRKDKLVFTSSNNDSIQRVNDGELWLTVAWDDVAYTQMSTGALFKRARLYIPSLGLAGGGDTLGVLKNAPHPAAAILLLSFLTEPEQQLALGKVGLYPARTDVSVTSTMLTEADRKNSLPWIPAQYKALFIQEFVKNCLMK